MKLATDDPRLIRLDTQCRALGLSQEQALSCLFFAVHSFCGARGQLAVAELRGEHEGERRWVFNFDDFALMAGVTPSYLLALFETGVAQFGEQIKRGKETLQ